MTPTVSPKCRPLADGSVRWKLYFRPALPDGTTLITLDTFTKPGDRPAVEAEAERYRAALRKHQTSPQAETCDQWMVRFTKYGVELGQSDAEKKARRWRKWISKRIGSRRPKDITKNDIEDLRDALDVAILEWAPGKSSKIGTCLTAKSAMNVWSAVTSSFKAMTSSKRRDLRVLDGKPNPCIGVEPPGDRGAAKARRKTFLYPKEAGALLACGGLDGVPLEWREVYAVALYTYLRPGELYVLTWADVDLDARHVRITKAWDFVDGKLKAPKTANGIRTVPIEPALIPLLERMKKGRKPSELVVPCLSAFGEDHLAQLFRKHLVTAGVKRPELHASTRTHVQSNFRSCRDSGLTWLAMASVDVTKIMRRAGHDMVQTTMGYVKLAEDITGDLGVPFAPLPSDLVGSEPCDPHVTRDPARSPSGEDDSANPDPESAGGGSRSANKRRIPERSARSCDPPATVRNEPPPLATSPFTPSMVSACAALATAARGLMRAGLACEAQPLIERLARLLELEVGPGADVVDMATARAKRG